MDYFTANIVSIHPNGRVIVQKKNSREYFVLPRDAVNTEENPPAIYYTAEIQVLEILQAICTFPNEFEPEFSGTIRKYRFDTPPKLLTIEGEEIREHVVAVVEVGESHAGVVSSLGAGKFTALVENGTDFEPYSFAIGEPIEMEPFYSFEMKGDKLWVVENEDHLHSHEILLRHALLGDRPMPETPPGETTFYKLRPLSEEEMTLVNTKCAHKEDLTLKEALMFIQDPMLSGMNTQIYAKQEQVKHLQLNAYIQIHCNDLKNCEITTEVHVDVIRKLTDLKIQDSWRMGNELAMRNRDVLRNGLVALIFDSFMINPNNKSIAIVKFVVSPRSSLVARMLSARGVDDGTSFTIGPFEDELQSAHEVIIDGFPSFFARKELFDVWRGARKQMVSEDIPGKDVPFFVDGKKLDSTQLVAMRMAAGVPGFTCVSAPPGSGKTFMISALVKSLEEQYNEAESSGSDMIKPRIAISATTNVAVTNAVESIHRHYPDMKVCREFSQRAEEELDQEKPENEINLTHMIESGKYDEQLQLEEYWKVFKEKEKVLDELRDKIQTISVEKGIQRLSYLRKLEMQVARLFVRAYEPTVFGTTAELMSRGSGAHFTHLIIDEASQMSPFYALALYCYLPSVTHVTLLGDSKQLGPHLILPTSSHLYQYQMRGELTRLIEMNVCPHHQLKTVYRCHPMLLDIWLKPIYGDLQCGATEEQRDYCVKYELLKSKVHAAPTLMVHVPTVTGSLGKNPKEVELVIRFLKYLKERKVPNEDITLLCHHRAQKEEIIKKLRDQGNVGSLGLLHAVHTVDSFQGKEAKIVLVLTTKTTRADDYDSIVRALSFVSDESRETVAISRASHGLYIFGDWSKLGRTPFWRQFGPTLMKYGAVVDGKFDQIFNPHWFTLDDPENNPDQENAAGQYKPRINLKKEFEQKHVSRYRNQKPNAPVQPRLSENQSQARPIENFPMSRPVVNPATTIPFDFSQPPPAFAIPTPKFSQELQAASKLSDPIPNTFNQSKNVLSFTEPTYTPTQEMDAFNFGSVPLPFGTSILPTERNLQSIWASTSLDFLAGSSTKQTLDFAAPSSNGSSAKPNEGVGKAANCPASPGFLAATHEIDLALIDKMFGSMNIEAEQVQQAETEKSAEESAAPATSSAVWNFECWNEAEDFAKKVTGSNNVQV